MRKSITALAVGSAALVAVPVVAGAQEADQPATTDSTVTDETVVESSGRRGHHGHRGFGGLDSLTDVLGLTEDEVRTALQEGSTLAEIASQQGVEVDAVVDALVAEAESHMAEAVAEERITQAEADEKLADVEERITEWVNSVFEGREGRTGNHGLRGFGGFSDLTELLGIERAELFEALQDGSTLAEVGEANGVTVDELRSTLLAGIEERVAEAVTEGRITQEEADERLAAAEENIDDVINGEIPTRRGGLDRGRFGQDSDDAAPATEDVSLSA